jgi:RimJ/RimL family protein N-acetyltransferase
VPDPGLTLAGSRVILRSTRPEDLAELIDLWNDGAVMHWVGFPDGLGYTPEKAAAWLEGVRTSVKAYHFCARTQDGEFLGEVFCRLDPEGRRAGLDIKFLPRAQGRGLSRDALLGLIDWVFATFPETDAVWTEPRADNLAARTLYYSCGLRETVRPAGMHEADSYWERGRG